MMTWRSKLQLAQGFFLLITIGSAVPLLRVLPETWQWVCMYIVAAGTWNGGRLSERMDARYKPTPSRDARESGR